MVRNVLFSDCIILTVTGLLTKECFYQFGYITSYSHLKRHPEYLKRHFMMIDQVNIFQNFTLVSQAICMGLWGSFRNDFLCLLSVGFS